MSSLIEELESLLFDWEADSLDGDGVRRVREILRESEEARAWYVRHQQLNVAMILESESAAPNYTLPGSTAAPGGSRASSSVSKRTLLTWLPFVVGLFLLLISRLAYLEFGQTDARVAVSPPDESDQVEVTSHGIALVTKLIDVEWGQQEPLAEGDALTPGGFSIESGLAQIEFFCGATVVLEGPAELELQSQMQARVKTGRLRAQVPPAARGFSLEVDDMKIVDLGTEFGLNVSGEATSVQVFDGEVELHSKDITSGSQVLTMGDAVIRNSAGDFAETSATPAGFLDIADLESRSTGLRDEQFRRWNDHFRKLQTDDRMITCYSFGEPGDWHRRLSNSQQPVNSEFDGAIVGATRVAGRWPAKSALEFKRPGDRVRVQIGGEYESLTFSAWVRIDSLDRRFNSLFLTDNYNKGEPHWQILETGQLYFSVRPVEKSQKGVRDFKAISPPFWKPSLSGRWLHLAAAYSTSNNEICHYLNGELLSRHSVPAEQVVSTRIGTASIGNWSLPTQPDASFAIRNLNGRIDEFLLFADALSADEVREIYENGKPW